MIEKPPMPDDYLQTLPAEEAARLVGILESFLEDMEAGKPADAEELVRLHPDLTAPLRPYLASLQYFHRAAGELKGGVHDGRDLAAESSGPLAKIGQMGDYRIVREVGRGGMGIVYEAEQISLGRRVALKVLPFANVLDPRQIARFKNEAQAAAQLHHTNIVPVFAVGCEAGIHYYAMQFVAGQSLARAIDELRPARTATAGKAAELPAAGHAPAAAGASTVRLGKAFSTARSTRSPEYFRVVARLGLEAAEALEHAHALGIVHRDVKPSNLMLDVEGKLWVTDFGLARCQTDTGLTMTGALVGTLRYMSPEQAGGKAAVVDHRTDIYSLGITLYELLTLENPFPGDDRQACLRRIETDEPAPPRRLNAAVPLDLETIVLKAIAKRREDRYATAGELAADLHRFLEDKPPLAKRPSLSQRAAKWARRHKPLVAAVVALLLFTLVGFDVCAFLLARKQAETNVARSLAQANLEQSEANYRLAREVIDRFCSQAAESLARVPGAEPLRAELLGEALRHYQRFIEQVGNDPSLRAELAVTYFRVGTITEQIGAAQEARDAYQQACELLETLVREDPASTELGGDLALCYNNLGLLHGKTGQIAEAKESFGRAIAILAELARQEPATAKFRADLALCHGNLGFLQSQSGEAAEAERSMAAAIALQETLAREVPAAPKYLSELALSHNNLGALYSRSNPEAAERAYQRALAIYGQLVAAEPKVLAHQSDLALCYNNFGALASQRGEIDAAEEAYHKALAVQRELAERMPAVPAYGRDVAVTYNNLAFLQSKKGRHDEAQKSIDEARRVLERMVRNDPENPALSSSLAGVFHNLGMIDERLDRDQDAAAAYREAIKHERRALERAPQIAARRELLDKHLATLGHVLRHSGQSGEAARAALERKDLWPGDYRRLPGVAWELTLVAAAEGWTRLKASDLRHAESATYALQAAGVLGEAGTIALARLRDYCDNELRARRGKP